MKLGRNRPGRKDQTRFALALASSVLVLWAGAAQAATGGLGATDGSSTAAAQSQASEGTAFTPMRWAGATWYGPGLYGNQTACGQVLRPATVGVAHRSLPCGTPVKFAYGGRQIVTKVIDRGPYAAGKTWDLTNGARRALGFEGTDRVLYAVALSHARSDRR